MKDCFVVKMLLTVSMVLTLWHMQAYAVHADNSLTAQMSLTTPKTVSLGEPIILCSTIVNTSNQTIAAHLGSYNTEWYSISLRDDQGKLVTANLDKHSSEPAGLHSSPDRTLSPNESITSYIVVTRDFVPHHPGRYQLMIDVYIPYGQVKPDQKTPSVWQKAIADTGMVSAQEFTYSLIIKGEDTAWLAQDAKQLQQKISAHPYGDLSGALTTALFSMPETAAAASWRVLVDNPGMSSSLYASELERLQTPTAADMLAKMLSASTLSSDDKAYVAQCLNGMYNKGNPTVREHIKSIATQRGIQLPEQVAVPLAGD